MWIQSLPRHPSDESKSVVVYWK